MILVLNASAVDQFLVPMRMKNILDECRIVLRQLSPSRRVSETVHKVSSLEELYDYCMSIREPALLELLIIDGKDGMGRTRSLTFTFRSISDQNARKRP